MPSFQLTPVYWTNGILWPQWIPNDVPKFRSKTYSLAVPWGHCLILFIVAFLGRTWNILVTVDGKISWLAASCPSVLSSHITSTERSSPVTPSKRLTTTGKYPVYCLYVYHLLFLPRLKVPRLSCSPLYANIDPTPSSGYDRRLINLCQMNERRHAC